MRIPATICLLFLTMSLAHANDQAFPRTEPGVIELKTLPAGRLLACEGEGDYFNQSNNLFGPLFNYIRSHDISMTTPVEARIEPGTMFFWVAADQVDKAKDDTERVRVIDVEERSVASIGARGSYSQSNFEEARAKLLQWIEERGDLEMTGEPYAVYWNGPFVPGPFKKFEVQVEVRRQG
jgi:effector-binding domain-containing protein